MASLVKPTNEWVQDFAKSINAKELSFNGPAGFSIPELSSNGPAVPSIPELKFNGPSDPSIPQLSFNGPTGTSIPQLSSNGPSGPSIPQLKSNPNVNSDPSTTLTNSSGSPNIPGYSTPTMSTRSKIYRSPLS